MQKSGHDIDTDDRSAAKNSYAAAATDALALASLQNTLLRPTVSQPPDAAPRLMGEINPSTRVLQYHYNTLLPDV